METAIRYSQNSLEGIDQRFIHVDVTGKVFKLCKITKRTKKILRYETITTSTKVPAFRAFDWHPTNENLVVVGQASGEATLLNIAEGQQDSVSFQVRSQRLCNAVSLNSQNLLAAGLDRVRTDVCLNIWDFTQRLPAAGSTGFSKNYTEPLHKLATGEPITSLKFFQDDPQLLVAGVKGQFVRLYDLREPSSSNGLQFATRCVHNLAIDWKDENYIASCYPTNEPLICLWDRRMASRSHVAQAGFSGSALSEGRQPEVSLELKHAIDQPVSIWSLRFAKSRRGCLGVLSSAGHLKVFEIGKDFVSATAQNGHMEEPEWETAPPQDIHLHRTQDIERRFSHSSTPRDEKARIVSFDFTTIISKNQQPEILFLTGEGRISATSLSPVSEPFEFGSAGFLARGSDLALPTLPEDTSDPAELLRKIKISDEAARKTTEEDESDTRAVVPKTSFERQQEDAELGFSFKMPLLEFLALQNTARLRCEAGYRLNATQNKNIVDDNEWQITLWEWIEKAGFLHKNNVLTQDHFDLSFLGVHSIWMEDIPNKSARTLGPTSARPSKTIENLVSRLNLPPFRGVATEYLATRQLCLYISDLSWAPDLLRSATEQIMSQNGHTKAAFIALAASDSELAHSILMSPSSSPAHKSLSLAIAGSHRQLSSTSAAEAWRDSINALAQTIDEPFAKAVLSYVKYSSWSSPILNGELDALPLYYRIGLALRHLSDSRLTTYISATTRSIVSSGDIEGIILTGLASPLSIDLFQSYIAKFSDPQTAVLALAPVIPRYLNDPKIVRKYDSWREQYRSDMDSWGDYILRARFDVAYAKVAVENATGRRLLPAPPPQIRLVCAYCAGSIAHHDAAESNGNDQSNHTAEAEGRAVMHDTAKNPLMPATAAAMGTVCPKCGRHLPRCGVCDMWLGVEDDTYMKWTGDKKEKREAGAADMSGSTHTVIGPATTATTAGAAGTGSAKGKERAGSSGRKAGSVIDSIKGKAKETDVKVLEVAVEERKKTKTELLDERMARFISFCTKCSHACHWKHARMWFEGDPEAGREGHAVCPVPKCECLCRQWGLQEMN